MTNQLIPFSNLSGDVDAIAEHLANVTSDALVMHGSVGITVEDFQLLLIADDRNIMACSHCNEFFKKYSNLLLVDETGKLTSAMFRDVSSDNPEVTRFFNKLADIVETGKPVKFVSAPSFLNTKTLGSKWSGGFDHYHGTIHVNPNYSDLEFQNTVVALQTLASKYDGFGKLSAVLERLAHPFLQEPLVTQQYKKTFTALVEIVNICKDLISSDVTSSKTMAATLWRVRSAGVAVLHHFNGSSVGQMVSRFNDEGDYKPALNEFLKITSPELYRRREANKVREQELIEAKAYLDEHNYTVSIVQRPARIEDIDCIWQPTADVCQDVTEADNPFDVAIKALKPVNKEKDDIVWPSGINISRAEFFGTVMPNAAKIMINLADRAPYGLITTPDNPYGESLFFWDRRYITSVPNNPVSVSHYGLDVGYAEVDAVAEHPWSHGDVSEEGKLPNGWMFCFQTELPKDITYYGLTSFGPALKPELYQHRRAIDAAIGDGELRIGDNRKALVCRMVHVGTSMLYIRVIDKDGKASVYNMLDL